MVKYTASQISKVWALLCGCQIIQATEARATKPHQGQSYAIWISKAFENAFRNEEQTTANALDISHR